MTGLTYEGELPSSLFTHCAGLPAARFKIETTDLALAQELLKQGVDRDNPVEFFGVKWHQVRSSKILSQGRGAYVVIEFQRLLEIKS